MGEVIWSQIAFCIVLLDRGMIGWHRCSQSTKADRLLIHLGWEVGEICGQAFESHPPSPIPNCQGLVKNGVVYIIVTDQRIDISGEYF